MSAWIVSARGQPEGVRANEDLWAVPDSAIAWFAFDPGLFGAGEQADPVRVLVERALRACLVDVPPLDRGAESPVAPVARLLELARGKAWPYRLAIMDLAVESAAAGARGAEPRLRVTRLAAVMDIRAPGESGPRLAKEVREAGPGVEVREEEGRVLVAIGHGGEGARAVIDRWVAAEHVRRDQAEPWHGHRTRASAAAGVPEGVMRGTPMLEAWLDLNALRRAMPDAFAGTRLHRLLREWRVINARTLMVHVHRVEAEQVRGDGYRHAPLVAIELSWSARSEPRDAIHAASIARAEWPDGAPAFGLSPQKGAYAILMRAEWGTWLRAVLGTYRSCGSDWDELARSTRIGAWEKKHAGAAARLVEASSGWVQAWAPGPDAPGEASQLLIVAPLKPGADGGQFEKDLAEVSSTIDAAVKFDEFRKWWAVEFKPLGLDLMWLHAGGGEPRALLVELKRSRPDERRP